MTTKTLKLALFFIHFGIYAASQNQLTVNELVRRGRIMLFNAITTEVQSGEKYLNLNDCELTSLDGIADLPGIATVQRLDVRHNRLLSLKKADLACMKQLKYLFADHNKLGVIDEDTFEDHQNLIGLSLSRNNLSDAAAVLRVFGRLQYIDLAYNKLEFFKPSVGNLTLQICNVGHNPALYMLPDTGTLFLRCTQLKQFPDTLAYCTEEHYKMMMRR